MGTISRLTQNVKAWKNSRSKPIKCPVCHDWFRKCGHSKSDAISHVEKRLAGLKAEGKARGIQAEGVEG